MMNEVSSPRVRWDGSDRNHSGIRTRAIQQRSKSVSCSTAATKRGCPPCASSVMTTNHRPLTSTRRRSFPPSPDWRMCWQAGASPLRCAILRAGYQFFPQTSTAHIYVISFIHWRLRILKTFVVAIHSNSDNERQVTASMSYGIPCLPTQASLKHSVELTARAR